MSDDPTKRFTLLVLVQAWQDNATELVIASSAGGGARIRYRVAGSLYEMSPPPSHVIPGVVAELGRLAGIPEGAFPKEGTVDVEFSGVRLEWKMRMVSPAADCILTPIRE